MESLVNLLILGMCLNVGLAVVTEGLGINFSPHSGSQDFINTMNSTINSQNQLSQDVSGNSGFINTSLIFGDFVKGASILASAISFQYLIDILQVFGFNGTFLLGVRAIGAIIATFGILYMITGRGTKMNI